MNQDYNKGNRAGRSHSTGKPGDPRNRRVAAMGKTGSDLGDGIGLDRTGRMQALLAPGSPLFINSKGHIDIDVSKLTQMQTEATFVTTVGGGGGSSGGGGGGGPGTGDDVLVNAVAVDGANFNDTTPAAPSTGVNAKWQRSGSGPTSISAYIDDAKRALNEWSWQGFLTPAPLAGSVNNYNPPGLATATVIRLSTT